MSYRSTSDRPNIAGGTLSGPRGSPALQLAQPNISDKGWGIYRSARGAHYGVFKKPILGIVELS